MDRPGTPPGRAKRRRKPAVGGAARSPSREDGGFVARLSSASPARRALLVFALAVVLRLFFWGATPDRAWPGSAFYQGDAALWLDAAHARQTGQPFELGLPLRPPGMTWLVATLWDGTATGVVTLGVAGCVLASLVPVGVLAGATWGFGPGVGLAAGLLAAVAHNLLVLSASLNNETPYLVLAVGAVAVTARLLAAEDLRWRPWLLAWGVLHGLAALVRVEHSLLVVGLAAVLALAWRRQGVLRVTARLALAGAALALTVLPWHLDAFSRVRRYNQEGGDAAVQVAAARAGAGSLPWEPEAAAERDRWPAFARDRAALFVAATVRHRGGNRVRAADLAILDEAFGACCGRPVPLPERFFVALYGPLSLFLAANDDAAAGFSRRALERPPPLTGGFDRFPAALVRGLPPPELALAYPPHLAAVVDGDAAARRWIRSHPRRWLTLVGERLGLFWSGAATGLFGWNLPLGAGGTRPPVDLVVATGPAAAAWRLAVLVLVGVGAWRTRRDLQALPWLGLLLARAVPAALVFGYARLGATAIPAVAVFAVLALRRRHHVASPRPPSGAPRLLLAAAGVAVLLEAARFASGPVVRVDGEPIDSRWPALDPRPHRVTVDWR